MTRTVFAADLFVPTPHSTTEEKSRFCAAFVRFVLRGFDRKLFKPDFYRRLSNIFGHIANYDADGFWEVWFSTPAKQQWFIRCIHEHVPVGDPRFCWSDVERELKSWAATEAKAVEAMLRENERNAKKAAKAESDRRAALAKKTHQKFRVVAKSTNLGGFGLRQYILAPLTAPPGRSSGATCTPGKEGKSSTFRWSTANPTGAVSPESNARSGCRTVSPYKGKSCE